MNCLSKTLVATAALMGAIVGAYLGPVVGAMVGTALFAGASAHASDLSKTVKAWPDDEYLLSVSSKDVPYSTFDRNGKAGQANTWVGTQTIQRADRTCYKITREQLRITPERGVQRLTVQESIVNIDCPVFKDR